MKQGWGRQSLVSSWLKSQAAFCLGMTPDGIPGCSSRSSKHCALLWTVSGIIRNHTKPEQKFNPLPQTQGSSGRALGMLEFKDTNSPGLEVTGWEGNLLAQRYHRESMFMLCEFNLKEVVGEADGSFNIVSPATETEPLHRILWITCSQNNPRPAHQTLL